MRFASLPLTPAVCCLTVAGAESQRAHPDAGMDRPSALFDWGRVYSIFVYLDDVEEDMPVI